MPIWFPPTPPQDDNDVYIDPVMALLYVPGPMPDDLLPVVQVKNSRKRAKTEAENTGLPSQRKKPSRTELVVPKSLFNRQPPRRRESKPLKSRREQGAFSQIKIPSRGLLGPAPGVAAVDKDGTVTPGAEPSAVLASAGIESVISGVGSTKNPDWLAIEDWKLLQAVQDVLEMPLSLCVVMPAHTPNWELVADIVNTVSSVYRSPKMCKQRFENEIAPREEGRSASDVTSVKKKDLRIGNHKLGAVTGTKTPTKPKIMKAHKSAGPHAPDNAQYRALYAKRFDVIKNISRKRTAPVKSSGSGQFQRNPKHINILTENGINFDKPLNPEQVAELRANRIQREKEAAKQQQLAQSQTVHAASGQQITSSQVSKPGISSIGQLTAIPLSGTSTANIIVNTSAFKKIGPHAVSKTTISNSALQQTLLRSPSTGEQPRLHQSQIQIQGQGTNMVSVGVLQRLTNPTSTALVTSVTGNSNAITLSSLARPASSGAVMQGQGSQHLTKQLNKQHRVQQQILQLHKQSKKITKNTGTPQKLQITTEAMKKLRQQQQQLDANVVTVAKVPGKGRGKGFSSQDLEQLLKNQTIQRTTTQKPRTAQVQIAPVHAQAQAQQVQEAAAQQAAQHIVTSKPLPLTVSVSGLVSAVNLSGISTTLASAGTSGQGKSLVMAAPIQQQLQRQFIKQRIATQQGQAQQPTQAGQVLASKVGMKQTVYAMVAASPQIVTQNKRRTGVAASAVQGGSSQQAQAATSSLMTVTKLLNAQTMQAQPVQIKQSIAQGSETLVQQVRQQTGGAQQLQMGQATIIPSSIAQQRLITPQRQIRQLQQPAQMILTPTSGQHILQRQANQNIVASLSLSAAASTPGQQQVTLSSPPSQSAALSQQLQSLLNPQVIRAQTQNTTANQTTVRNVGQQHHLVLQQQPSLTVGQQNAGNQIAVSGSSTALIPSLVLPVSAVARSQTQTSVSDVSSVHFVAKTTSQ